MPHDSNSEYRNRLFARYITTTDGPGIPSMSDRIRPRLPYLRRLIRTHFPSNRGVRILDLGCGHGALLHVLNELGYSEASGVDESVEQVALARAAGIDGVRQGNLMQVLSETSAASLDVVVAFDVLEHFTKPELIGILDHVHRVLTATGRFVVHVPNAESPFASRIRYGDFTHELAFTPQSLSQLFRVAGFGGMTVFEDRPVVHGVVSFVRRIAWFCLRTILIAYIAIETGLLDWHGVFSQSMLAVAVKDPTC